MMYIKVMHEKFEGRASRKYCIKIIKSQQHLLLLAMGMGDEKAQVMRIVGDHDLRAHFSPRGGVREQNVTRFLQSSIYMPFI